MKKLLNNLYVTTNGSYIHKERETFVIEQEGKKVLQLPFHAIQNLFCFGHIMVSPDLMAACGEKGISISFFSEYGKFQSRIQGPQSGNVLLRRAQYREADDSPQVLAQLFIAAKLSNCRTTVMRHQRNHGKNEKLEQLVKSLGNNLKRLQRCYEIDRMRGIEGDSAASYFGCFSHLIVDDLKASFPFSGRTKRPPLDRVNALLSFAYTLLTHEIASALQGVGIDPYVGFLHTDRPGRLSLALDMLEEFRAWWCDRFVLTLINRKQISPNDFIEESSGAIRLKDDARKKFLVAWQERKQDELQHPYTDEKIYTGLLPPRSGYVAFALFTQRHGNLYPLRLALRCVVLVLITYDVSLTTDQGAKRLRHISKTCLDFGIRVQYSVFECEITPAQWVELKETLLNIYDPDSDSLRFYHLGSKWKRKVEHYGAKETRDMLRDTLIV